jgi:hypothetical protein
MTAGEVLFSAYMSSTVTGRSGTLAPAGAAAERAMNIASTQRASTYAHATYSRLKDHGHSLELCHGVVRCSADGDDRLIFDLPRNQLDQATLLIDGQAADLPSIGSSRRKPTVKRRQKLVWGSVR